MQRYRYALPVIIVSLLFSLALLLRASHSVYAAPRVQSGRVAVKVTGACPDTLLAQAVPIIPNWYEVEATSSARLAGCAQVVTPIYDLGVFQAPVPQTDAGQVLAPNDPAFRDQWHLPRIQASAAWDKSRGDGAVIAVLDTGVDHNHPDLQGKLISRGKDFINTDDDASDDHGHGTHVAGIVAAATNNALGVAGVGYNARVLPVKVMGANGRGSTAQITRGMDWASQQEGVKALNLSLGSVTGQSDPLMADAVALVRSRGVAVIAAAGNAGVADFTTPAGEPGVLGVGATDANDRRAYFSNYGGNARLAAPGVGILSTTLGGGYQAWDGTSMAAPVVSGVYALAAAACPACDLPQLEARVLAGDDIGEQQIGRRVNALYAVGSVQPVTPTPAPTRPITTPTPSPDFDAEVVALINASRRGLGLPPLTIDPRLVTIARDHNAAMLDCAVQRGWNVCFVHRVPGEPDVWERLQRAGYAPNAGSETIGYGQTSPRDVVNGWLGSPAHRAIMHGRWSHIGCDYANPNNDWRSTVWTCNYGLQSGLPTPTSAPLPGGWRMQVEADTSAGKAVWDDLYWRYCDPPRPGIICRWVRR